MIRNSEGDLDKLSQIKGLSWLSPLGLKMVMSEISLRDFKKHEVVASEAELASEIHFLLSGVASITCLNAHGERVTVAMLAPGPVPEFPTVPSSQYRFQCEAHSDCRVGSLGWERFNSIASNAPQSAFRNFHQNNLQQWYRLLLRGSSFLSLDLHERIAMTLLELCSDFGIEESRGTLLRVPFSHKELANLVGASRPRVTEHLARLERDSLVIRQGRQLIVRMGQLRKSVAVPAA